MSFTDWFWEVSSPNSLFYSLEERKEKSCCLCTCYLLFDLKCLPHRLRFINDQIVEDEVTHNPSRFLVWGLLLAGYRESVKCFKFFSDASCEVQHDSFSKWRNRYMLDLYNKPRIVATFFLQQTNELWGVVSTELGGLRNDPCRNSVHLKYTLYRW